MIKKCKQDLFSVPSFEAVFLPDTHPSHQMVNFRQMGSTTGIDLAEI